MRRVANGPLAFSGSVVCAVLDRLVAENLDRPDDYPACIELDGDFMDTSPQNEKNRPRRPDLQGHVSGFIY